MPAYLIVLRTEPVRDEAAMVEYQRKTRETAPTVPLKPLVVHGTTIPLEGEAPDGVVMIEFASVEDAKAWYNSPDYQAALPHRLKAAGYQTFIVEGL
ncbi:hypothetical protein GCM10011494_02200 [Novosphingobium endophyticum]|uniref:DUF1330 domain-containing protein n=1 Tax=Novosphingobium endophyticum TaxID=1955250 RepID=A0A916X2Z1_9SPHN|nr:DUF1330 domain-containing protein [Novosphingobium endophyticum]GGB87409.1 hypothetical protein GCM10011494_02200 [Novosphingobium endophyticum]